MASSRKKWRKLYAEPPASWQMLRAVDRGIGCELLRRLDDTMTIPLRGKAPHQAVGFLLGAQPEERRLLKGVVDRLLDAGVLTREGDAIVAHIPDAPATLPRHSDDASATLPQHSYDTPATLPRHSDQDNNAESFDSACVEERRGEERRGDETRARGPVPWSQQIHEAYVAGWRERFGDEAPPPGWHIEDPVWDRLAGEVRERDRLGKLLDAFWRDAFCQRTGFKPRVLHSERARLLTQGPEKPKAHEQPQDVQRLRERLREESAQAGMSPDEETRKRLHELREQVNRAERGVA